jgi:3-(3-hydroxy-phenyl)propionate hydroxylase
MLQTADSRMFSDADYDVAVVGYGLAGATAGSLLARLGHRVAVFERYPSLYGLPRTISFDGESQRIVDKACDHSFAMRESTTINAYEIIDANLELIVARHWNDDKVCGFHNRVSFYQPHLEEALDEGARRHGAEINLGWEAVEVSQSDDVVSLVVQEHAGANEEPLVNPSRRTVTARYLVGADGAKSTVRRGTESDWTWFGYRDAWLSVDVTRKLPLERIDPHVATQIVSPERVIAAVPIGDRRIRFEFLLGGEPEDHQDLTPEAGYQFLEEAWGITRDEVDIYRSVVYPFEGRMVRSWRTGRVLLAGDAAHLMPPFTGMGAVSAFRDAGNLAWKLDFALRGITSDAILDTYQEERAPNTLHYIEAGVALGHLCTLKDREAAAARDAAMRSGGSAMPEDPEYDFGILHKASSGPIRPAGKRAPMGTVRAGDLEGTFDCVVGWGFSLVLRGSDPAAMLSDRQREFLARIGCSVVQLGPGGIIELDDEYERWFAENHVVGFLCRPDFRLFGGIRSPGEIPELVDDLESQLRFLSAAAPTGTSAVGAAGANPR